jgi:hypothetical protein
MKKFLVSVLLTLLLSSFSSALNIIWVSDQLVIDTGTSDNDGGASGVFGSGAGPYPDEGILNLLRAAGHTITRFNPSNSSVLSATEVATLNLSDLIIIGRSIGSGSFDTAAETLPWNSQITKPLLVTNTFISRNSRLGWFTGSTQPDVISNQLTFTSTSDPVSAYIIGSVSLSGSTTVNPATELVVNPAFTGDRGISLITDTVVPGGTTIASSAAAANSTFIGSWPAGTTLQGTSVGQTLGGYRMQFLVGNREPGTAPDNVVGNAGFENLTPDGEGMFLRAVAVAGNNGLVPIPEPGVAGLLGLSGTALLLRRRR